MLSNEEFSAQPIPALNKFQVTEELPRLMPMARYIVILFQVLIDAVSLIISK